MIPNPRMTEIVFDPNSGFPIAREVVFECLQCHKIVPSMPKGSVSCQCGNVRIDADYGRITVGEVALIKAFRVDDSH